MSDDKKFGLWLNRKTPKDGSGSSGGVAAPKNVKQRWLFVGVGLAGFGIVASTFFASPPPKIESKKADPAEFVDLTPKGSEEQTWQRKSQADIAALVASVQDLKSENKKLSSKLEDAKINGTNTPAGMPNSLPGIVPPPTAPNSADSNSSPPPPVQIPPPPAAPSGMKPMSLPPIDGAGSVQQSEPLSFKPEKKVTATGSDGKNLESVKAKVSYKKNPYSGLLPAGAFAPIALLNGLDAGTSVANQSNPQPVLMQIQDQAVLPGAANYKIKSCFALGSAYGDLSAERVYVRLARLSCVDKANHLVLTSAIQGYVVDSDGKLGLRGVITDRQGARLGKALLAGFAQGLAGALGTAQGTTSNSILGSTTSLSGSDALRSSGLSGASGAANQLAQFYLKEAQSIFPVITVDTGRTATLVFSDSVSLKWGDGDVAFTKEVTPN